METWDPDSQPDVPACECLNGAFNLNSVSLRDVSLTGFPLAWEWYSDGDLLRTIPVKTGIQ